MTLLLGIAFHLLACVLVVRAAVVLGRVLDLTRAEYSAQLLADEDTWARVHVDAVARGDRETEGRAAVVLCELARRRQEAEVRA